MFYETGSGIKSLFVIDHEELASYLHLCATVKIRPNQNSIDIIKYYIKYHIINVAINKIKTHYNNKSVKNILLKHFSCYI